MNIFSWIYTYFRVNFEGFGQKVEIIIGRWQKNRWKALTAKENTYFGKVAMHYILRNAYSNRRKTNKSGLRTGKEGSHPEMQHFDPSFALSRTFVGGNHESRRKRSRKQRPTGRSQGWRRTCWRVLKKSWLIYSFEVYDIKQRNFFLPLNAINLVLLTH